MQQLALEMALPPSYAPDDIAITPANAALVSMLDAPAAMHGAGLLLIGASGSGKTHLARRWANRHGAICLPPEQIGIVPAEELLQGRKYAVIDPLERVGHWSGLVALMNEVRANGGQILATAEEAPNVRPLPLADAQSRVQGLVMQRIPDPDDALLEAHLRKRFSDWQWQVDENVLEYILPRLPRDYVALTAWLERLRAQMAAKPARLTIPALRDSFAEEQDR
jgi:chromosomal replication initiation ATPase DnaA